MEHPLEGTEASPVFIGKEFVYAIACFRKWIPDGCSSHSTWFENENPLGLSPKNRMARKRPTKKISEILGDILARSSKVSPDAVEGVWLQRPLPVSDTA
jgi:hypothetical protein